MTLSLIYFASMKIPDERENIVDSHKNDRISLSNASWKNVMFCAISYLMYNFKNVKNIQGGVLLLLKITHLHGCFSRFLNCTKDTKSRNASHISTGLLSWLCTCSLKFWSNRQNSQSFIPRNFVNVKKMITVRSVFDEK